jgi:hypothetical protein
VCMMHSVLSMCAALKTAFAGKPRAYRLRATPVGARLAREGVWPACKPA